jgi:LemA protein
MGAGTIIALIITGVILILSILVVRYWISSYNKFQYWINRAERKFADIDVVLQERLDKIQALAQIVKKYDIHEWKALKETIEARSRWTKDTPLNEKVNLASDIENSYFKIQAVVEKYPELKADRLHLRLMESDSRIEKRLRITRLEYNRVAQQYNERVMKFPRNIVAKIHHFTKLDYLTFVTQEPDEPQMAYSPKDIFKDN